MAIWITEASAFRTGTEAFEEAVRGVGGELRWLSVDDEFRGRYGRWDEGEAVVFRGSFEAAEGFRRARPDTAPGVVGKPDALRCAAYYPKVGSRLLNLEHRFLPLADLRPRWPELQERWGSAVFVRPDSGEKAFTGQVVTDLDLFEARERPYLDRMDPSEPIVVAPLRRVEAEWRTVVVGKEVVAGSRYKRAGIREVAPEVPADALSFARETASEIDAPAHAYMLDVAREEDGRLSVVELNSFSCSDLYACDPVRVVEAMEAWVGKSR